MSIQEWLKLNKRVKKLERLVEKLQQDNLTLISTPFLEPAIDLPEGEVIPGREVEEDFTEADVETVEEREYREEVKWLAQRKQKEELV